MPEFRLDPDQIVDLISYLNPSNDSIETYAAPSIPLGQSGRAQL